MGGGRGSHNMLNMDKWLQGIKSRRTVGDSSSPWSKEEQSAAAVANVDGKGSKSPFILGPGLELETPEYEEDQDSTLPRGSAPRFVGLCPALHMLQKYVTYVPGFTCDVCSKVLQQGANTQFCRECDFDVCAECAVQQKSAPELSATVAVVVSSKSSCPSVTASAPPRASSPAPSLCLPLPAVAPAREPSEASQSFHSGQEGPLASYKQGAPIFQLPILKIPQLPPPVPFTPPPTPPLFQTSFQLPTSTVTQPPALLPLPPFFQSASPSSTSPFTGQMPAVVPLKPMAPLSYPALAPSTPPVSHFSNTALAMSTKSPSASTPLLTPQLLQLPSQSPKLLCNSQGDSAGTTNALKTQKAPETYIARLRWTPATAEKELMGYRLWCRPANQAVEPDWRVCAETTGTKEPWSLCELPVDGPLWEFRAAPIFASEARDAECEADRAGASETRARTDSSTAVSPEGPASPQRKLRRKTGSTCSIDHSCTVNVQSRSRPLNEAHALVAEMLRHSQRAPCHDARRANSVKVRGQFRRHARKSGASTSSSLSGESNSTNLDGKAGGSSSSTSSPPLSVQASQRCARDAFSFANPFKPAPKACSRPNPLLSCTSSGDLSDLQLQPCRTGSWPVTSSRLQISPRSGPTATRTLSPLNGRMPRFPSAGTLPSPLEEPWESGLATQTRSPEGAAVGAQAGRGDASTACADVRTCEHEADAAFCKLIAEALVDSRLRSAGNMTALLA